jgi:hypothetical protein
MEYRAIDINEFRNMNQTMAADAATVQDALANLDFYVQKGRVERSAAVLAGIRSVRRAIGGLFS